MQAWLPRILVAFHRPLVAMVLLCFAVGVLFDFWTALLVAGSFYLAGVVALFAVYLLAWWVLDAILPPRRISPALARYTSMRW